MPFYVADYLADTGHLSTTEHGAYLLLIMHYWQRGGLPCDDAKLASIARASLEQWQGMRVTLAELFGDGWKHPRIDKELEKSQIAYEKRALAGKAGGTAKAAKSSNATAMPDQKASNALPTTITTTFKKEGANAPISSEPEKSAPSAVAILPTVSEGDVPVFEADIDEWAKAFPAVDVRQQLAVMRSWLLANPTKRKTKRGMRKFVVAWLDRKQNAGTAPPPRSTSPPKNGDPFAAMDNIFRAKGWIDEPASLSGNSQDDQRLPTKLEEHRGPVVDLRRGPDGDFGSSDLRDSPALSPQRNS